MNAEPKRLTREDVTAEPWKFDSRQWRSVHGIHIPWIAEISPMQVGMMGKQQRARYDKERAEAWQASRDGSEAWRQAVIAAFDAGRFAQWSHECSDETNTAIFGEMQRREEEAFEKCRENLTRQSRDLNGLKVGDLVWCVMTSSYVRILKLSAKSARITYSDGEMKVSIRALEWIGYREIEEQAKAGVTVLRRKEAA